MENRTELGKTFPGPWPKLRSYSPGEFGRNYLGANLVNSMLCRSAIGRASQLVRVPHLHHQNRKLILISREQKGLASCQFYQMPLYLLPLLGPRVSLGLENQFLSHSGIFSRPLEEKLQSRTKALPLLSQHPSLLQGIRTSGGGEHRTYQVQLITLDPLGPATPLLLALLHTLELVPVPAHCGLPSKTPRESVLGKQFPRHQDRKRGMLPDLNNSRCASGNFSVENLQPNTPCPPHAFIKVCRSVLKFMKTFINSI